MQFTPSFWLQIAVYVISFVGLGATTLTRLNYLEKKMDKHNCLIERMAVAETEIKDIKSKIE